MNSLFALNPQTIKSTFGTVPPIKGSQGDAVTSVSALFSDIGNVLTTGKVSASYGEFAMQKLYEAQQAVNAAIQHGWDNGKGAQY